jgi:MFS family permease
MKIGRESALVETSGKAGVAPAGLALGDLRRRLVFVVVLAGGVAASMVYVALSPILPKLAAHFGGADAEMTAQLGSSMPSLGIIAGGALSGWAVARLGLRPLLIWALAGFGLFGTAGAFFGDIWGFSATRLALGFCGSFLTTACVAWIAELYDEAGCSKMIGYWKASMGLSVTPIVLAAGALGDAFGWRGAFAVFAGLAAPAVVLALFVVPGLKASAPAAETAQAGAGRGGAARLWPLFLMIFALHIMMMMGNNQIPFVLKDHGLTSASRIALVMGLTAPLGGVASILSGHWQARFGERATLCGGVAAAGVGAALIGLAPGLWAAAAGNAVFTLGTGTFLPLYMTMPINRVSAASRGAAIGLVQVSMYLGAFANPLVLKPVREAFGLEGMYLFIGLLALAGALAGGVRIALQGRARTAPAGT